MLRMDGDRDPDMSNLHAPGLEAGPDIGSALKSAREFRGMTLQDVADQTRIRRAYLAAIEDMRLDELPSRPFTIGYVRAYANALALDGDQAVERFKADEPAMDEPLRAPVGLRRDRDPRVVGIVLVGVIILGSILLWNIAQRAMSEQAPPPPSAPEAAAVGGSLPAAATGPVSLGAPLPAPVESTTPTPYITPGMAEAELPQGTAAPVEAAGPPPALTVALPTTFTPDGPVYGAPAQGSAVTLQARRSTSVIIRGQDGSVYFARQLAPGEAYRVPMLKGLSLEVADPSAMQVFVAGQSKGLLPESQMTVSSLLP